MFENGAERVWDSRFQHRFHADPIRVRPVRIASYRDCSGGETGSYRPSRRTL